MTTTLAAQHGKIVRRVWTQERCTLGVTMIYEFECLNGHKKEVSCQSYDDKGCETIICKCGHTMAPLISAPVGPQYFRENNGRVIDNLSTLDEHGNEVPCPPLTSRADYERQKKLAGVTEAGNRMGMPGVWI